MVNFKDRYDVAIVGAGPAGTSVAIRLATRGFSVLLVEKAKFPREKLCGEFISPECLSHFKELGVLDEMLSAGGSDLNETVFYGRNGNCVSIKSSWFGEANSAALSLSRGEMDLRLLNRARAVGVDVREETSVSGVLTENTKTIGLKIKGKLGNDTELFADITIDATGRNRVLARRFDRDEPRQAAKYVAFKTHLRSARVANGACEIYAYPGGYGGCNRVEDELHNLCFIASSTLTKRLGSDPERVMREMVFANVRAAETMRDAVIAKPWIAVPIQGFGRSTLVPADGLITVGDAAAFIDPFTGSGMLMALESGRIASEAILASTRFPELVVKYQTAYAAAFDRRLRVCSLIRHVAFVPFLAESTISMLSLSSALRRRLARATRFNARSVS
jgi:flavin-dependent dehydrogenase